MKILGHPIHLMLIHFPAALFPVSLGCSIAVYYTGNIAFSSMAFYSTGTGIILGWLAVFAGVMDLIEIAAKKKAAVNTALLHAGINILVLNVFTIIFYGPFRSGSFTEGPGAGVLFAKAIAVLLLLAGNYFGGQLVLKYKVVDQY